MHRIALATAADAYEIASLSRCVVEVGLRGWSWNPRRVSKAMRTEDTEVVAVRDEYHLIAAAVMEVGEHSAHLSLLAVAPYFQRKGIGTELVRWLEKVVVTAGARELELEMRVNNYGARSFYHELGYRETYWIRNYYGVENAVCMSHTLQHDTSARIS